MIGPGGILREVTVRILGEIGQLGMVKEGKPERAGGSKDIVFHFPFLLFILGVKALK